MQSSKTTHGSSVYASGESAFVLERGWSKLARLLNSRRVQSMVRGDCLSGPIDMVRCFHNAFRRDMAEIDNSVLNTARKGGDMAPYFDRLQLMGEILGSHSARSPFQKSVSIW